MLSSHGRGIGPRDALKKDSRGLSRVSAGSPVFPGLVPVTSGRFVRVPLRSQGYCGVGRGLSGLHWVWCNGRGPHLKLRQEPQASSPFLTPIAGSLQSWDRRVRPRLGLRHGTPLASRGVQGVRCHLSSCIWNLRVFPEDAPGCKCHFVFPLHPQGCLRRGVWALGSCQEQTGKSGSFRRWHSPRGSISNSLVRLASS